MKRRAFTAFDAADYLKTDRDTSAYLAAASEDEDPRVLMSAIGDVVRARNVSKVARDAGLTREGVYKAFSARGNPSFATVVKVARALDLDFAFHPRVAKPKVGLKKAAARGAGGRTAKSNARLAKP